MSGSEDVQVRRDDAAGRFEILVDGVVAGQAEYSDGPDGVREFPHTVVASEFGATAITSPSYGSLLPGIGEALADANNGYARAYGADDVVAALTDLTDAHLATIRTELGRIPRQVSGYHLRHLLPEEGFDVARALVGSEGTCAIVTAATPVSAVPQ